VDSSACSLRVRRYRLLRTFLVFFLITRPPPSPTLFPYTTLFRSSRRSAQVESGNTTGIGWDASLEARSSRSRASSKRSVPPDSRSEEHTSELQSLTNLVCRLLLEKKKNIA